ncbi:hypothetical protein DAPPUDRAFT_7135, partial [Daphnia pulex]
MKTKWMKAFRTLTNSSPSSSSSKSERREQRSSNVSATVAAGNQEGQRHVFQENTYKKITPCDVCSQVLRGHSRQGWKCRLCKINVHADCKSGVGRCLPKSRLLRRQKSSSELE